MIIGDSVLREVHGLDITAAQRIIIFLQGSVYCWCNTNGEAPFAANDLVGGVNVDWGDTPLQELYDRYLNNHTPDYAFKQAGKDLGWLLKRMLYNDTRRFRSEPGRTKSYRWIPE